MVYVARNPKDVIVSYYFHNKLIPVHGYTGTLEEFANYFMDGLGNIRFKFIMLVDSCNGNEVNYSPQ